MTKYHWDQVRAKANEAFGETPRVDTERDILDVFREAPSRVIEILDRLALQRQSGNHGEIRSWWALARSRIMKASPPVVVDDSPDRDIRERNALKWINLTGAHYDREDEVVDELFGIRGKLRFWVDDDELRAKMVRAWQERRHLFLKETGRA